jgi:hypothetical protein
MLYRGKRTTVPASEYGIVLDILEATGWTWDEWQAQPADLADEMIVKFAKRIHEQNRKARDNGKRG